MRTRPIPSRPWLMIMAWVPGILLFAFILLPLLQMTCTQTPRDMAGVIAEPGVIASIWLSIYCAFLTTMIAGALGIPAAFILSRGPFFGKRILEAVVDLPLAVPHTVAGIALLFIFGRKAMVGSLTGHYFGLDFWGTTAGIVVGMLFVSVPYTVNMARAGFEAVDPQVEKAARTLGASPGLVFRRIQFPLALPNILSGLVLTYARSISEFGAVVFLAFYPMTAPVKIYEMYLESGLHDASAAAVLLLGISLFSFILLRYLFGKRRWS